MTALRNYQTVLEALTASSTAPVAVYQVVLEALVVDSVGTNYDVSLTIAGTSDITRTPGFGYFASVTTDGFSSASALPGDRYQKTLTVAGTADLAEVSSYGIQASLTVAGISDIARAPGFGTTFVLAGFAACSASTSLHLLAIVTVAGSADFFSPGGLVHFIQRSIDGVSDIGRLPGWGYLDTLTVGAVGDTAQVEQRFQNDYFSIEGVSDLASSSQYGVNAPLTVAGLANFAYADNVDAVQSAAIGTVAFIGVENIFDILYGTQAVAGFLAVGDAFKNNSETAASQGSFSASCTGVFNRAVAHALVMEQFATYKKPTAIVSQSLAISQSAVGRKTHLESLTQTLSLTQNGQGFRGTTQTLVLTQVAACVKVLSRTVSQTLALAQVPARTIVVNRSVSQTLVFNHEGPRSTPMISSQGGGGQTPFQYNRPLVSVMLVPKNCLVVLGSPTQTVVLPCPIFGDTQAYTGELNLKRTMTGDTFTYVRRTDTEKLKYTFNLGTYKARELQNFLVGHSHELITLHNWKGETWYVFLSNNPFEFTNAARWQPKGERVDITLEFEGIRT